MRRTLRFVILGIVSTALFAVAWFVMSVVLKIDRDVTLAVAGVVLTIVIAPLTWWATREIPEDEDLRLVAAIIAVCALLASGIGPVLTRSFDGATAKQGPTASLDNSGPPILGGGLQPTALIKAHGGTPTNSNEPLASGVSFSLDGRLVVTAGADYLVRLWQFPTGELAATLNGHISPVAAVAVNPVTGVVASAGEDRTIRLWDTSNAKPLGVILTQHTARITTMAVSPTGKYLATGAEDSTVRVFDAATGAIVRVVQVPGEWPYAIAFSPDDQALATGSGHWEPDPANATHVARIWQIGTGARIGESRAHKSWVISMAFSLDSSAVISASQNGQVLRWPVDNPRSATEIPSGIPTPGSLNCMVASPDQKVIALNRGSNVALLNADNGDVENVLVGLNETIERIVFSRDGKAVAAVAHDGAAAIWKL